MFGVRSLSREAMVISFFAPFECSSICFFNSVFEFEGRFSDLNAMSISRTGQRYEHGANNSSVRLHITVPELQ